MDLIDPFSINMSDFERTLAIGKDETLQRLPEETRGLMGNTIDEITWWSSWKEEESQNEYRVDWPRKTQPDPWPTSAFRDYLAPVETVRNREKIGRNEPCPCGSGKKYKKCCGR